MPTEQELEYQELVKRLRDAGTMCPEYLLFWVLSMPHMAALVWAACPRADWMIWIARQYGYSDMDARLFELELDKAVQARREQRSSKRDHDDGWYTPRSEAADLVRHKLAWHELAPHRERSVAAE